MWSVLGAILQGLFAYISLCLLLLLMFKILDLILPHIPPQFKFLTLLAATDLFFFGAISVTYLTLSFTEAVVVTSASMTAFGTAIGCANLVMGIFAVGYQIQTGEPLMRETAPRNSWF